ncbi:MAG: hypothetical protein COA65_09745 [Rhodospirillaceae bacterium]|nr:MAG: hypothetical protein COA65_09745 [Rhodospirillaceae bacterium]
MVIAHSNHKKNLSYADIDRYLDIGQNDKYWYRDERANLEELFPHEDINLVIDLLCATSINSSLKSNVALFYRALYQYKNNEPFKPYLPNMASSLELARQREPFTGRKIRNFAECLKGNTQGVIVDVWIARAFKVNRMYRRMTRKKGGEMREGGVSNRFYTKIEKYIQARAPKLGLEPRQMCSMIWGGIRTEKTGIHNTTRWVDVLKSKRIYSLFPQDQDLYTKKGIYIQHG